jgi:transposase-like protein
MELRIFFSLIKEYVDKANKFVDETGGIVEKFKCPLCQKNFVNDFDSAVSTEVYIDFEILEKMSVEYVKYMKQDYLEMSGKERTRVVF